MFLSHFTSDSHPACQKWLCIPTGQKMSVPVAFLAHTKRQRYRHFHYASTKFLHPLTKCTDEVRKSSQFFLPKLCNRIIPAKRSKIIVVYFLSFSSFKLMSLLKIDVMMQKYFLEDLKALAISKVTSLQNSVRIKNELLKIFISAIGEGWWNWYSGIFNVSDVIFWISGP